MEKNTSQSKKFIKAVAFVGLVFVLSGISLIVIDRFLFPKLVSTEWFSKYKIFKKATENVVVVNKTEQVMVSEDKTISGYSNKAASSVVEIISRKKKDAKAVSIAGAEDMKVGSGMIVTSDGLVITQKNAFLAEADYQIVTGEGEIHSASLAALDSFSDMALFKVDGAENLPTASYIAPEDIKVGTKVVVVGRSGSNAQLVFKSGLLSRFADNFSVGGLIASSEKLQGVYFSDIEMSDEGDSSLIGSAVADYNGNIVGILGSRKSGSSEQPFIISVSYVDNLVKQYIEKGAVRKGALGLYFRTLTKEDSITLSDGRTLDQGAQVFSPSLQQGLAVLSGSAAEKAGIRVSDIITSVNGEEINSDQNLAALVSKYKPGDSVDLKIIRDGKDMNVKAVLQ